MYEGPGPERTSTRVEASIGGALAAGFGWLYLLLPAGAPDYRSGWALAVGAGAAVGALYFLAREIGASPWAAATAAAAFGASHGIGSPARGVADGSLHILFVTLILLAGLRYRRTGRLPDMAAMALVGSLGLAYPMTMALMGPALLCLCGRRLWRRPGRGRRLATFVVLLPVGPALCLLLAGGRAEPQTAGGHVVTAPLLAIRVFAPIFPVLPSIPDAPALAHRLCQEWALFRESFPGLTLALPLLGAGSLWLQRRSLAAGLLVAALAIAGGGLGAPIEGSAGHLLGLWMLAAALVAVAVDCLRAVVCGPRQATAFAVILSIALVGASLRRTWTASARGQAQATQELARPKQKAVDPDNDQPAVVN